MFRDAIEPELNKMKKEIKDIPKGPACAGTWRCRSDRSGVCSLVRTQGYRHWPLFLWRLPVVSWVDVCLRRPQKLPANTVPSSSKSTTCIFCSS